MADIHRPAISCSCMVNVVSVRVIKRFCRRTYGARITDTPQRCRRGRCSLFEKNSFQRFIRRMSVECLLLTELHLWTRCTLETRLTMQVHRACISLCLRRSLAVCALLHAASAVNSHLPALRCMLIRFQCRLSFLLLTSSSAIAERPRCRVG